MGVGGGADSSPPHRNCTMSFITHSIQYSPRDSNLVLVQINVVKTVHIKPLGRFSLKACIHIIKTMTILISSLFYHGTFHKPMSDIMIKTNGLKYLCIIKGAVFGDCC